MSAASDHDRILALDVARGLAVFGILLMNMRSFSNSLHAVELQLHLWPAIWDRITTITLRIFAEGKFLSLFSLLFGYSMVIFRDRAIERGARFWALWLRRMLVLFVLGLLHGLFIWYGDILVPYAVLGIFLLLFSKRRPRTLYTWAFVALALIPIFLAFIIAFPVEMPPAATGELPPSATGEPGFAGDLPGAGELQPGELGAGGPGSPGSSELSDQLRAVLGGLVDADEIAQAIAADNEVYGSGDVRAIQRQRTLDWIATASNQFGVSPMLFGLFLLGAGLAKQRLLHDVPANRRTLKRIAIASAIAGFGVILAGFALMQAPRYAGSAGHLLLIEALQVAAGAPALALCYLASVALAVHHDRWRNYLLPLAAVGRLALTNYIGQSIICTLIFYGYGLGLFGKVGPLAGACLAVVIFAAQLALSRWWLRRFRMGPLEWLWRAVTYLSLPQMRSPDRAVPS